jgi:RNA polymerase sigma-70 factor (ECF subfamily)
MAELDDEQVWIRDSQNGDHEAFESLVGLHQRMIHALTYRMTGSWEDSRDLAQETFIQAFRKIDTYRHEAKFSSWLYRIALNQCLNWRKSRARREEILQEWGAEQITSNEEDHAGALSAATQAALMKLNPKQRAAVVMTLFNGLSHAEAAKKLGCAEVTVSWRVFAAKGKLKKLLKNYAKDGGQ